MAFVFYNASKRHRRKPFQEIAPTAETKGSERQQGQRQGGQREREQQSQQQGGINPGRVEEATAAQTGYVGKKWLPPKETGRKGNTYLIHQLVIEELEPPLRRFRARTYTGTMATPWRTYDIEKIMHELQRLLEDATPEKICKTYHAGREYTNLCRRVAEKAREIIKLKLEALREAARFMSKYGTDKVFETSRRRVEKDPGLWVYTPLARYLMILREADPGEVAALVDPEQVAKRFRYFFRKGKPKPALETALRALDRIYRWRSGSLTRSLRWLNLLDKRMAGSA